MKESEIIDWLVAQDPRTIQEWLSRVWKGEYDLPEHFHWKHVAATFDIIARHRNNLQYRSSPDLSWAIVTISLYHYLITQAVSVDKVDLKDRMMQLKAYLVLQLGTVSDDPILDEKQFSYWFFTSLHLSREAVEEEIAALEVFGTEALVHGEILRLMQIKERLKIIQFLSDRQRIVPDNELEKWLTIRERLP